MILKRLKIVEQIIIISLISVLVPSVISWFIINNVSQHSLRQELHASATMLAGIIENNISAVINSDTNRLNEIIVSLEHISGDDKQNLYLKDLAINTNIIKERIADNIQEEQDRRIYIVDTKGKLIFSHNYDKKDFDICVKQLPVNLVNNIATRFDEIKNQPRVYLKMDDINLIIIVNTSQELTKSTINKARLKILAAFLVAAAVSLILTLLYSYYLYLNIRQLFKGIMAVAKGNYQRKITPLRSIFTPREIIFLSDEFNSMIGKINSSYKELEKKNEELKLLDSFRSNLVDTVSHELRTPLTSIRGYTSRLLRTDIQIDDETKHKSLLVIKQQSERLSRMIEDLLVIPDIEGAKLNINIEPVNLLNIVEASIYSVKNIENREVETNISYDFPLIMADKDRLEQVMINLISNANKYAYPDTAIKIDAIYNENNAYIKVINSADFIEKEILDTLFDKFIRLDDRTTRTTRGTGLGLYIVKGLIKAMNGKVEIKSTKENIFSIEVILPLFKDEKIDEY